MRSTSRNMKRDFYCLLLYIYVRSHYSPACYCICTFDRHYSCCLILYIYVSNHYSHCLLLYMYV